MTTPLIETPLQKERRLFSDWSSRLGNTLLNKIFDLLPERAAWRVRWMGILFFVSGFVITLYYYPLGLWLAHLREILLYVSNPAYQATHPGNPITTFGTLLYTALTDPRINRFLPLLMAPFVIAKQSAAIYLADIFNIEDVSIARGHINEIALGGSDDTMRISKGEVVSENRESSNYLIGGPGKVQVDLDSVALFERPDGTPHVIGPTGKLPGGKASISGFERLRETIDIRDHYIELRSQDDKTSEISGKSKDGFPVSATDVRMVFSILRDPQTDSDIPHVPNKKAVENIVYKAVSQVTPDKETPSTYKFSWMGNMLGAIRGELGGFMRERNLTEFLANIGLPEATKLQERNEAIQRQTARLAPSEEPQPASDESLETPSFTPRHKITSLFEKFTKGFATPDRGVQLQWIGIGSWKTSIETVSEDHIKAWQINRENETIGSEDAMLGYEAGIIFQKMVSEIRELPFAVHKKIIKQTVPGANGSKTPTIDTGQLGKQDLLKEEDAKLIINLPVGWNTKKDPPPQPISHSDASQKLLLEYRKFLLETAKLLAQKNKPIPPNLQEAVKRIDNVLGLKHWAGLS